MALRGLTPTALRKKKYALLGTSLLLSEDMGIVAEGHTYIGVSIKNIYVYIYTYKNIYQYTIIHVYKNTRMHIYKSTDVLVYLHVVMPM